MGDDAIEDFEAHFVTVRLASDGSERPELDIGSLTSWEAYALLLRAADALWSAMPEPAILVNGMETY